MPTNREIAEQLRLAADLLEQQQADGFRVTAYRRAADTVARSERAMGDIVAQEGVAGLTSLPTIGRGIANAIYEIVATGRWSRLERLRGELDAVRLFQVVPGIGPALAENIHETLQVDSLEALETAAHDGRLATVPGVGPRRAAAVRAALEAILGRARRYRGRQTGEDPEVALLLRVDADYRRDAEAGRLPTIAPKRFNPQGKAWLPVLHGRYDDWQFTALYSNTARAHELNRTRDWVVLYSYDGHHHEGQHTVVTENRGPLAGKRVVRGRETECMRYYGLS